jgi:agmatinase
MSRERANMPFTGIATFARAPLLESEASEVTTPMPNPIARGFAVYGIPFDCAMGFRTGQRLAPRSIRDMSTRLSMPWGSENPGYWDVGEDRWYLEGCSAADAGDADPLYFDVDHLDESVQSLVARILQHGAIPCALGGDHSVTFPAVRALAPLFLTGGPLEGRKLHIVQIDAHLDFTDSIAGFRRSNSSGIRRAAELDYVGKVSCLGLRGIRTSVSAYQAAQERGHQMVTMQTIRRNGLQIALDALPTGEPVYITLDIDALDPAFAPGTSSPEPGGLTYEEVRAILQTTVARNQVVAMMWQT